MEAEAAVIREVRGHWGLLAVGYQQAAALGDWRLVPSSGDGFTVRGTRLLLSAHWWRERPMTLSLDVGADRWHWDGVEPVHADGTNETTVIVEGRPRIERGVVQAVHRGRQ